MKNTVMTNDLPRFIHDDKNGLDYTLQGDYYFPELTVPETEKTPIGKYGLQRLAYLREHRPGLYTRLILSGKLYEHLEEILKDAICTEPIDYSEERTISDDKKEKYKSENYTPTKHEYLE